MALLSEIGQPTFVEVIRVDPFEGLTCESKAILGNSRWQNPTNRFDVNGDGVVDESDYNVLLSWIGQFGQGPLPALKPSADPWVDVNGDGVVDDKDIQQLSNYLTGARDESDPTCHRVSDFRIERDLLDPAQIIDCTIEPTVRAAACHKNIIPTADYTPYFNLCTGLLETTWDTVVKTKDSIIYVHNDLLVPRDDYFAGCSDTPRVLNRILKRLQADPFPYRYDPNCRVLPDWPDNTSDWKPGDVGTPVEIPDEPILPEEPEPITTTTTPEPTFGLLERVVIINILGNAERYLTVESWYENSSARVGNGPRGFEATGTHYLDDRTLWEQFIDSIADNDSVSVRAGIIHPKGTGEVWPSNRALPKDSYGDQIDYIAFDLKSPRVSVNNIINAFNIITQNGQFDPTLLIFVTDQAEDSQWATQISQAGAQLRSEYPRMEVKKYPFSRPFHRWIMMDLDAMLQLIYQRDNINTDLNSNYRTNGVDGVIEDAVVFQPMRQGHIEYRLVNNDATVVRYEVPFDSHVPGGVYDGNVTSVRKGTTQACYAILNPFGWSISSQIAGTGSAISRPQRTNVSFTSNPYFVFQQDTFEHGFWSLSYVWTDEIVIPTIDVVDSGGGSVGLRTHIAYAHAVSKLGLLADYLGGMQLDVRVDAYVSANISDTRTIVYQRARGIETCNAGYCPRYRPGIKYQTPENVIDVYPVTHLDPTYGLTSARAGYYVSVWYNELHAIVTEGGINGPRTKDHYVRSPANSPQEERQRAIIVYSDPDFQDKIYNAVRHYFQARSRYTTLEGSPNHPFNSRSWLAYTGMRHSVSGFPLLEPTEFLMRCPRFPVSVR